MLPKYGVGRSEPTAAPAKAPSGRLMRLATRKDQSLVTFPITGFETINFPSTSRAAAWKYARSATLMRRPAGMLEPQRASPCSSTTHRSSTSRITGFCRAR